MKKSVKQMIENECAKFIGAFEIPKEKLPALIKLAKMSYEKLPHNKKHKWTLEDILKQGL